MYHKDIVACGDSISSEAEYIICRLSPFLSKLICAQLYKIIPPKDTIPF